MDPRTLIRHLGKDIVHSIIIPELQKRRFIKTQLSIKLLMEKRDADGKSFMTRQDYFNSTLHTLGQNDDPEDFLSKAMAQIERHIAAGTKEGSGWSVKGLIHIVVNVTQIEHFYDVDML